MEDSWHQLSPKTGFVVRLADRLTDQSWQTLTQLYQPIIGPLAAGLFSGLFWLPQRSRLHRHGRLLAALGVDLAHLYAARLRLEATGLLTTTVKQENDLTTFCYTLHAPLVPARFFRDDLLSVQLLDVLGEETYQDLVTTTATQVTSAADEENITKNFLDVFHVDGDELSHLPTAVTTSRQTLSTEASGPELAPTSDFDFHLLGEILRRSFVELKSVQPHRELLLTEHTTYGLDELTLAHYIGEATNLATNQFDPEQFKRLIAQRFGQEHRGRPVSAANPTAPAAPAVSTSTAGTDSAQQALIKLASETVPANFLQAIKQKTGGFVTDGEQRVIRDLVGRHLFPTSVLNLMVYHVLVDEDRPTLNKALLDTIANDWSKAKVATPEQAIAKIRERQQAASRPRSRQNRRNAPTVKETLPDWAKKTPQTQQPVDQKLSSKQKQAINARIARFKQRHPGKEES